MIYSSKIAIIGGTGKAGSHIVHKALEHGYQVRMLVRNPKKLTFKDSRVEVVEGNVQNTKDIHELLKGCQIVINTFGQPVKENPIYSSVTKEILKVMANLKIERYISVTGGSLTIDGDKKSIMNRVGAKLFQIFYSDLILDRQKEWRILKESNLIKWTLIRLPFIVDSTKTGRIKESLTDMPGTKITSQDIAAFIIQQIENPQYVKKAPFISN